MKRKLVSVLFSVLLLCGAFYITGCDNIKTGEAGGSAASLAYGKKYIYKNNINVADSQQRYIIFNENGTGAYKYYESYDKISSYTITFRYFINGATVDLFYDAVEYAPEHNGYNTYNTWCQKYTANKNYLCEISNGNNVIAYISEDFLSEIPNFGK